MNGLDRESGLLLSCWHFIGGSSGPLSLFLIIMPVSVQSSWNFYEHWSASIDFFSPTLSLFFFSTPQIFEILISGVSEFLGDEIASSETAGNKMKKLEPRRRAPAHYVLRKPHFFPLFFPSLSFFPPQIRLEIQSTVIVQN